MATDSHYFSSVSSAAVICIEYSSQFRILQMVRFMWPAGIRRPLQPRQRGPGWAPPTRWPSPAYQAQANCLVLPSMVWEKVVCEKGNGDCPGESTQPEVASFPEKGWV